MIMQHLQLIIIACLTATACVLPGIFLVLRGIALMSDAISHAVLLGIIIMFFFVPDLSSWWLLVGAAMAGVATVLLTECIIQTQRLKKDAAIGLIYPLFFSIAVILITQCARDIHLDIDMVFLGELVFAPFNRLTLFGHDIGPAALWQMGAIATINGFFVWLFYKELVLCTFDKSFAFVSGFSPVLLYYLLMILTSITAVGAFDVVGSIVVVALMITPAATGYLLTERMKPMIFTSIGVGIIAATFGYICAHMLDVSIAGSIASATGILFLIALLFSPKKGLIKKWTKEQAYTEIIAKKTLVAYLSKNKNENKDITQISVALGWTEHQTKKTINSINRGT